MRSPEINSTVKGRAFRPIMPVFIYVHNAVAGITGCLSENPLKTRNVIQRNSMRAHLSFDAGKIPNQDLYLGVRPKTPVMDNHPASHSDAAHFDTST